MHTSHIKLYYMTQANVFCEGARVAANRGNQQLADHYIECKQVALNNAFACCFKAK